MSEPIQVDRRMFQVQAATAEEAMAAIRGRAEAVHPDTIVYLTTMGTTSGKDGNWTVLADYWRLPVGAPT